MAIMTHLRVINLCKNPTSILPNNKRRCKKGVIHLCNACKIYLRINFKTMI